MSAPFSSAPQPDQSQKSSFWPVVLSILCGAALAVSSCYGFLISLTGATEHTLMSRFTAVGFVIGLVGFLAGCFRMLVRLFDR
jgi:hypothetical protein